MTAPAQVQSVIVQKIIAHYAMIESDVASLQAQLTSQLTITYRTVIQAQLVLYGCQKTVTGPDNQAAKWIEDKARKDAEGIANTYNRELANRVRSIYSANKRTNRFGYMSALDTWLASRTPRKTASIGLNTMTAAREYAQTRFVEENNIQGKWVFTGPPPVCKICLRIKALGAVTFETTKKRRLPAHINCPHRWQQLIPKAINCAEAWTG